MNNFLLLLWKGYKWRPYWNFIIVTDSTALKTVEAKFDRILDTDMLIQLYQS